MATGNYGIADLIATRFANAKQFGLDTIAETLQRDLAAHNAIVEQMMSELCEVTTDARRIYGGSNSAAMVEVDQFGRAPTQKNVAGAEVGFPLRLFQYPVGWTRKYLESASVADIAQKQLNAEKAHKREIQKQIKKAIFGATNYTFTDRLVDNVDLAVKRFINADSADIPDGPNGETFTSSTHTHYHSSGTYSTAQVEDVIQTVIEHGHGGDVKFCINIASEATVRADSTGFVAYLDRRIRAQTDANTAFPVLDTSRLDNRAIGIAYGAEVWVKPWVPSGYAFVYDAADGRKPLAFRQRNAQSLQGLRLAAEFETYPLTADYYESEFGVGVWTRTNGAAIHWPGSGDAWADATIT